MSLTGASIGTAGQAETDMNDVCNRLADTLQRIHSIGGVISRIGDRAYGETPNAESTSGNVRPVRSGAVGAAKDLLGDISDALDGLNKRVTRIENIA